MIFDECQIDTEACTGWEELKAYVSRKLAWEHGRGHKAADRGLFQGFLRLRMGTDAESVPRISRLGQGTGAQGIFGIPFGVYRSRLQTYWSREMLERWDAEMSGALQDVQQEKDEKQRSVLTRNIVLERASVRYLLASVFADDMAAADLQKAREAAKKDITDSGITNFCERHPIGELFEKWGV